MADSKISNLTEATSLADTDLFVIAQEDTANKKVTLPTLRAAVAIFDAYALLRDEKTAGTAGGTFTSGSWQTRTLNTELFDVGGFVTLSSNQFTLQAGTYFLSARAPSHSAGQVQAKVRNITDSTDTIIGGSGFSGSGDDYASVISLVAGRFTIAGAKTFELQHQCFATQATNGFGVPGNFGVIEVYAEVEIWREAA